MVERQYEITVSGRIRGYIAREAGAGEIVIGINRDCDDVPRFLKKLAEAKERTRESRLQFD